MSEYPIPEEGRDPHCDWHNGEPDGICSCVFKCPLCNTVFKGTGSHFRDVCRTATLERIARLETENEINKEALLIALEDCNATYKLEWCKKQAKARVEARAAIQQAKP